MPIEVVVVLPAAPGFPKSQFTLGAVCPEKELVNVTDECDLLEGKPARLSGERWESLRGGEPWYAAAASGVPRGEPLACIPLKLEERTSGVLAIYKLLEQKDGFTSLDQEILGLLVAQAAATLIGARTFTRSGGTLDWDPADDGIGVGLA